jgi:hypothetical protein
MNGHRTRRMTPGERARALSHQDPGQDYFVIRNPDFPEQGNPLLACSGAALDTYYYGQYIQILAVYCHGRQVE